MRCTSQITHQKITAKGKERKTTKNRAWRPELDGREAHLPPAGLTSIFTGVVISIARSCVLLPNRYPAKVLNPSPDPVVIPESLSRALSS